MSCELELCTCQELIAELVKRRTFLGVVVHATNEVKGTQPITDFTLTHGGIPTEDVITMLESAARCLKVAIL